MKRKKLISLKQLRRTCHDQKRFSSSPSSAFRRTSQCNGVWIYVKCFSFPKILTKANPVLMTFDRHPITLGIRLLAMIVDMSTHVDISAGSRNQRKRAKEGVQDSDVWGWIYDDWSKGLYRGVWWLLQGGILRPLVKPASPAWSACKPTAAWVTEREIEREERKMKST